MNQSDYDKLAQLIKGQQGMADDQQKLVEQAKALPVQTDYSPLMGLVDSWSGGKTNLASSYQRPESPEERLNTIARLQKAASGAQDQVNDSLISRMNAKDRMDTNSALRRLASTESKERKIGQLALSYGISVDKSLQKLGEQEGALQQVIDLSDLSKGGNSTAFSALGAKMAKAMGEVGVLTENDVKRYVDTKMLSRRAANTLSLWKSGVPDPAQLEDIKQIAAVLSDSVKNGKRRVHERAANRFAINTAIPLDEAYERLQFPSPADYDQMEAEKQAALKAKDQKVISLKDIEASAKARGTTVDEIKKQLRAKKYVIEGEK